MPMIAKFAWAGNCHTDPGTLSGGWQPGVPSLCGVGVDVVWQL